MPVPIGRLDRQGVPSHDGREHAPPRLIVTGVTLTSMPAWPAGIVTGGMLTKSELAAVPVPREDHGQAERRVAHARESERAGDRANLRGVRTNRLDGDNRHRLVGNRDGGGRPHPEVVVDAVHQSGTCCVP